MEIEELQKISEEIINKIDNKLNVKHNDSLTLRHLIEEFGELANEIDKPDLRNGTVNKENVEEELADMILLLTKIADNNNINLEQAINNKIQKLKQRHSL